MKPGKEWPWILHTAGFLLILASCRTLLPASPGASATPNTVVRNTPSRTPFTREPGYTRTPLSPSPTTAITKVAPSPSPTLTDTPFPTPTSTSTPTEIRAAIPGKLQLVYEENKTLYLWTPGETRELHSDPDLSSGMISPDGEWIVFLKRPDRYGHKVEIWVMPSGGGTPRPLFDHEDLVSITGKEHIRLWDIDWLSGENRLLFNTHEIIEGPPGYHSSDDLYLLDMTGKVTRLAKPGFGGVFFPSPDGKHVAVINRREISLLNPDTGGYRLLLECTRPQVGFDCDPIRNLTWDPDGRFFMISVIPQDLHYPSYSGEPEQVWRFHVTGEADLLAEVFPRGVSIAPDPQRFFAMELDSCIDATHKINLYELSDLNNKQPYFCTFGTPYWAPDSEHFIIQKNNRWHLGSIEDTTLEELDFLQNLSPVIGPHILPVMWIDETYFLVSLSNNGSCTLNLATLDGILTEIFSSSRDRCGYPRFSYKE